MASTEIFFNATSLSVPKKSLPFIRMRFTVLPLIFIVPSSAMSTPGYFLISSSSIEPSGTRNAAVLNTSVSSDAVTGGTWAVTTALLSRIPSTGRLMTPQSVSLFLCTVTFFSWVTHPTNEIRKRYLAAGAVILNLPSVSLAAPALNTVSGKVYNCTVAACKGFSSSAPITTPLNVPFFVWALTAIEKKRVNRNSLYLINVD